eukprot:2701217-Pleurochrysis_carterae.AAC.1
MLTIALQLTGYLGYSRYSLYSRHKQRLGPGALMRGGAGGGRHKRLPTTDGFAEEVYADDTAHAPISTAMHACNPH